VFDQHKQLVFANYSHRTINAAMNGRGVLSPAALAARVLLAQVAAEQVGGDNWPGAALHES